MLNQRAIGGIIGLMSVALLGIIIMQAYWINESLKASNAQFDKNVIAALSQVSKKLEYAEVYATTSDFLRPAIPTSMQSQIFAEVGDKASTSSGTILYQSTNNDSLLIIEPTEYYEEHDKENCNCANCQMSRIETNFDAFFEHFRTAFAKQSTCDKPIDQRIDFNTFDDLLRVEMRNQGIQMNYNYGIYSEPRKSFVVTSIQNPQVQENPDIVEASMKSLLETPYKVRLFPTDIHLPGYLMVSFVAKDSYLLREVLPMLIGSILFSGIILFCFAYTIQVIFNQKKFSDMKSDFINNMTHEFKTPIATISIATDTIVSPKTLSQPEKIKRFADIIQQENRRMLGQVEKVLQMAQLDKNKFNLNVEQVDVHDIIENAIATISLQVEKRGGKIIQHLDANIAVIEADETHVTNAIYNLLDNANKYSPETPEITVYTKNTRNSIQIAVQDKGLGMTREARKNIFNKFYRVPTGNRHDVKGFGLGLSYVKAIMTAHKGDINVKSELGKGSTFTLNFRHELEEV
jgi:two-component system, OmpR family, phosphate regulon sensor histidine kinase PhoR